MTHTTRFESAAQTLLPAWRGHGCIDAIPADCRPRNRAEGYAVQAALLRACGEPGFGWKIAATSAAGQQHIGVSGPLAGRLLASRRLASGDVVSLEGNSMRVAEAEFAFRMARDLPADPSGQPLSVDTVMSAVQAMHLAIEVPNSRLADFVHAGEAQLIADFACACFVVIGEAVTADWRALDLSQHGVSVRRGNDLVATGSGANVLGDPRLALTWLANELLSQGQFLAAGDIVITGTSVVPVAVSGGEVITCDFGVLGTIQARLE
jgi:2-keto-4-pentenoate hydratase